MCPSLPLSPFSTFIFVSRSYEFCRVQCYTAPNGRDGSLFHCCLPVCPSLAIKVPQEQHFGGHFGLQWDGEVRKSSSADKNPFCQRKLQWDPSCCFHWLKENVLSCNIPVPVANVKTNIPVLNICTDISCQCLQYNFVLLPSEAWTASLQRLIGAYVMDYSLRGETRLLYTGT